MLDGTSSEISPVIKAEIEAEKRIKETATHLINQLSFQGWSRKSVELHIQALRLFPDFIVTAALKECGIEWPEDCVKTRSVSVPANAAVRPQLLSDIGESQSQ